MSKAKDILDERLAKGEISIEEYETLVKSIGPTPPPVTPQPSTTPSLAAAPPPAKPFNILKFWWVLPIIGVGLFIMSIKNNVVIENLSSQDRLFGTATVSAVLYNNGSAKK